jgi:hypothetical protein
LRSLSIALGLFVFSFAALAQSDRGTITGTVSDSTGAVVPNAPIEAKNVETGALYPAASSSTGNYTLSQLPAGTYEMSVSVTGFKKYVRTNIVLPVAQTLRLDIPLEVGATGEAITVSAEATLLKTESGELSHNISTNTLDDLPVLQIGGSSATGLRNPYAVLNLLPGTSNLAADLYVRINGTPSNTQSFKVEGQDAYSGIYTSQSWTQPSVDAVQEIAVQTSNFAAEYGQAGGGVFNVTMRSGTNQFHGTAYEYWGNNILNAGIPFTVASNNPTSLSRPVVRRNDFGFTVGGPVEIPKLYHGRDKTFFFFSFEEYREIVTTTNTLFTVPTAALRGGDFSGVELQNPVLLNGSPLVVNGSPVLQQEIFDPMTTTTVNGQQVRTPFPNQQIPTSRIDPVAAKIQALIPQPNLPGSVNNFNPVYSNLKVSPIPSVKIDHALSDKIKLSGYWGRTATSVPNHDGLPDPITTSIAGIVVTHTARINYDQVIRPTLLLHLGGGFLYTNDHQLPDVDAYDPAGQLGLTGLYTNLFPRLAGLNATNQPGFGGGAGTLGPYTPILVKNYKTTANASLTWVRGNHTYKFGGEMLIDGYPAYVQTYANGNFGFAAAETGLPFLNGAALTGSPGYSYASFLLGAVDTFGIGVPTATRLGNHGISGFAQDSWKVTHKLTLEYGMRYDFQTYLKADDGVMPQFAPNIANPSAGGRLGATQFEATCKCSLASNYPYAFGPRLGVAYQVTPKTVIRVGAGVAYSRAAPNAFLSYSVGSYYPIGNINYGSPLFTLAQGSPYQITWPNFSPGQYPLANTTSGPLISVASDAGRPARQTQWSIGVQRELSKDLLIEAAYVGNRGVWWTSPSQVSPNAITPQMLTADGFNLNNAAAVQTLLAKPLSQVTPALIAAAGLPANTTVGQVPYAGFPITATVAQSIRPYPQFGGLTYFLSPALGNTWYDSMQAKLTKRYSHGLTVQSSFTWAKQMTLGTEAADPYFVGPAAQVNDVFNREQNKYLSGYDQPFLLVISPTYTTPKPTLGFLRNKIVSYALEDWQFGSVLRYGSGLPILSPTANNALSSSLERGTFENRVPGVPLYTQDLNCHCFDPSKTFVLNPAAWSEPGPLQFGSAAAYYTDYRYERHPVENVSLGRRFNVRERMNIQIRMEFTNIFNRTYIPNPSSTGGSVAPQLRNATTGQTTSGFGQINTVSGGAGAAPRSGQLIARFTF